MVAANNIPPIDNAANTIPNTFIIIDLILVFVVFVLVFILDSIKPTATIIATIAPRPFKYSGNSILPKTFMEGNISNKAPAIPITIIAIWLPTLYPILESKNFSTITIAPTRTINPCNILVKPINQSPVENSEYFFITFSKTHNPATRPSITPVTLRKAVSISLLSFSCPVMVFVIEVVSSNNPFKDSTNTNNTCFIFPNPSARTSGSNLEYFFITSCIKYSPPTNANTADSILLAPVFIHLLFVATIAAPNATKQDIILFQPSFHASGSNLEKLLTAPANKTKAPLIATIPKAIFFALSALFENLFINVNIK